MKKTLLSLACAAALGMGATAAQAAVGITIDPDGVGGVGSFTVQSLDWNVGNSIAVADQGQSLGAGSAFVGQLLTAYAHASLGNFLDTNGDPVNGTNLNNGYQWTFVSGFRETLATTGGPTGLNTTSTVVLNSATNFFRVYYDTNFNSSNLSGKGFNDGTLILEIAGLAGGATGNGKFTPTAPQPVDANGLPTTPLDGFLPDNYANYKTLIGQGSTTIDGKVTFYDPNFFKGLVIGQILALNFTTQQVLNYQQQNPSSCYWTGAAYGTAAGNGITNGCGTLGDFGTIGQWNGISGTNVLFQTDASTSFNIPEPGTLAMLGLGLFGFGWASRRKSS